MHVASVLFLLPHWSEPVAVVVVLAFMLMITSRLPIVGMFPNDDEDDDGMAVSRDWEK